VGYVIALGGVTVYHAGDTDHAPELDDVRTDLAFVPIGGHYTMNATEAGRLVRAIEPRLAVPMHFGFVVGSPSDADRFREAAAPVAVEVLTPQDDFERA
jgi:L-ascorbate metabolism protein UlaG (beta-lactamase superfamily)